MEEGLSEERLCGEGSVGRGSEEEGSRVGNRVHPKLTYLPVRNSELLTLACVDVWSCGEGKEW